MSDEPVEKTNYLDGFDEKNAQALVDLYGRPRIRVIAEILEASKADTFLE